ncbi:MAG TPA: high-affinity nickel-transport family protein [Polyangiaceae bacterium]|nr:high-affinity nickel-transport family protein [Polyangiaceae bacterium]
MNLAAILALGFLLGMRHATEPDHVVAVSTIASSARALRPAALVGALWGVGHTATILVFGGVLLVCGIVVPPPVGMSLELAVAAMLVVLGVVNVRGVLRVARRAAPEVAAAEPRAVSSRPGGSLRPVAIGVVHGLAGSAAVALLVLGEIPNPWWGLAYLVVFGTGTVAGMVLVTLAIAMPFAAVARRFDRVQGALRLSTGCASVILGAVIAYRIGFVQGLFTGHSRTMP